MCNFYGTYAANAIFRNQPNYTYFGQHIREDNPLYLTLNELEDYFMKPGCVMDQSKQVVESVVDPRTKQRTLAAIVNHGLLVKPVIFNSFIVSSMNFKKHSWGMQRIHSLQLGESIKNEDLYKLNVLNRERQIERNEFLKFSYNHHLKNKNQLIASIKPLQALYNDWYTNRKTHLKQTYANKSYNTFLGLPHTKICKTVFGSGNVFINQPVEVTREGFLWETLPEEKRNFNITNRNLNSYMEEYMKSENTLDELETNLKCKFLQDVKSSLTTYPIFYIPIESLLFLLTAGDYNDLPTEMFLEIKEEFNTNKVNVQKVIVMDEPLPARICGWHTTKKIIESVTMVASSVDQQVKLQQSIPIVSAFEPSEALNHINETIMEFKPIDFSNYFAKSSSGTIKGKPEFTKVLCKWCLKLADGDVSMSIYTSVSILGNVAADHLHQINLYSIKLEYKAIFGCEIMTKYELLREWLHLKLLNITKNTCYRLNVSDYKLLAKEVLTLQRIEESMLNIYHINCSQVFYSLNEFLKLLLNVPTGQYLLRYNFKFPDKFMLCQPSEEFTQNTIQLHNLMDMKPSDLLFISKNSYLPIADNICSTLHIAHNILPCAFYPKKNKPAINNNLNNYKGHLQEFSDRETVLHCASIRKASILKAKQCLKKKVENLRRRYRKRIKAVKMNQIADEKRGMEKAVIQEKRL